MKIGFCQKEFWRNLINVRGCSEKNLLMFYEPSRPPSKVLGALRVGVRENQQLVAVRFVLVLRLLH